MSSKRLRYAASLFTGALLALTVLGPAGVSAADTRQLYVGDPALIGPPLPNPYNVTPTAVSPGNTSYFDVLIKNLGKQTLTSATVGMGTLIADNNGAPGPQLPAGWTIQSVTPLSGVTPVCSFAGPTGAYVGLSCNFGNLSKSNPAGTIRVFLTAGSALATSSDIVVSGKVAEAVGGNVGGNNNTFYAYGAGNFFVTGDGKIAGLFSNKKVTPANHVANKALTTVDITTISGDYVVSIDEVSPGPTCPVAFSNCSTTASTIAVNLGKSVSPYFIWTVQFPVAADFKLTKNTAFIHFFDTYDFVTNPTAYEVFYNTTQYSCEKPKSKPPCADFSLVTDSNGALFLQVIFETTVNGAGKYA